MTRIVEHREEARAGEEVFELRVFRLDYGEVRACVVPADFAINHTNHTMIDELSQRVVDAFLDRLARCDIPNLWIHDPHGFFARRDRPIREM
jgi:hypothetical protein